MSSPMFTGQLSSPSARGSAVLQFVTRGPRQELATGTLLMVTGAMWAHKDKKTQLGAYWIDSKPIKVPGFITNMRGKRESRASWQEGLGREKAMQDGGQRHTKQGVQLEQKGSQHRVLWNLFFKRFQDASTSLVLMSTLAPTDKR